MLMPEHSRSNLDRTKDKVEARWKVLLRARVHAPALSCHGWFSLTLLHNVHNAEIKPLIVVGQGLEALVLCRAFEKGDAPHAPKNTTPRVVRVAAAPQIAAEPPSEVCSLQR